MPAVLGIVSSLVSASFAKPLLWLRQDFMRLPPGTQWLRPVAGGLLAGILRWFVPEVPGVGYNHVSQALNGQLIMRHQRFESITRGKSGCNTAFMPSEYCL